MRLVCVPSPLLACNPCNMSWCQSFPWFMALSCCLSVTTMLLCTPSYCCYSTVPCPSPILNAATCQGIAPMTPHLCAQGIAPMTPHLCAQGIAPLCRALDITLHPCATIRREDCITPRAVMATGCTPPHVAEPMCGCYQGLALCLANVCGLAPKPLGVATTMSPCPP